MKKTLPTLALAAALTLAGCGTEVAPSAAPSAPSASPVTLSASPAASSTRAPFTGAHVVSARMQYGYFWIVTDLPNTAASVKIARGICERGSAYALKRYGRKHLSGVSVRAKGDRGRLILRPIAGKC